MTEIDPLAGQREAINEGVRVALTWPDDGNGCPVEVGQVFKLRSCWIEITRKERIRRNRKWTWVASFRRHTADRLYLLGKSGGYVDDAKLAMRAQDSSDPGTMVTVWADNPLNIGGPPEPEAVPPEEVATLNGTVEADVRYRQQRAEEIGDEEARRKQERAIRDELRETLRGLPPEQAAALLGSIQRQISEAQAPATQAA